MIEPVKDGGVGGYEFDTTFVAWNPFGGQYVATSFTHNTQLITTQVASCNAINPTFEFPILIETYTTEKTDLKSRQ